MALYQNGRVCGKRLPLKTHLHFALFEEIYTVCGIKKAQNG